jgi:hypothetical protein
MRPVSKIHPYKRRKILQTASTTIYMILSGSVVDPWHFGTNPDPGPRIRFINGFQDVNK